ncbi:thioesterase II family protein [Streptomyces sp. NBC_00083]|uniref:thioesterase II family protein n=1 Tax=Streptomyces sp. NBC_00083 TaxID=2975647 RepID=UPI0022514ED9|nr:thioesterase domain-containing protein [Streptomyces sp. NBC_00083]MCX5386233.1 thioesterase domain-containing protein [Streptomyces sp. NBC_00083]
MTLSLLCIPFAGSGAGFYRAWPNGGEQGLRIVPLQMPGREERFMEAPYKDAGEAAEDLAGAALRLVGGAERVALFGHSLGAVLAYETARALRARGFDALEHLFVSGSPGPRSGRTGRTAELDDDTFVERVAELAGYRHEALDDPDLRDVLLPLLRADVALHEDYRPVTDEPLTLPVTALRGADDALVSRAQCADWEAATTGPFELRELAGGHMYLTDGSRELLAVIEAAARAART